MINAVEQHSTHRIEFWFCRRGDETFSYLPAGEVRKEVRPRSGGLSWRIPYIVPEEPWMPGGKGELIFMIPESGRPALFLPGDYHWQTFTKKALWDFLKILKLEDEVLA